MTIAQVFDDAIIQSPYENPIIVTYKGQKMTRGDRAIAWIEEYCRVPSGASTGKLVSLLPFQKDFLKRVYDNPRKTRRAILSIGRKNGKTAICAFLMLLHLVGPEAVRNGQLYSAARSTKQAGILFELAAKTVLMSPKLKNLIHVVHGRSYMRCERYGTVYKSVANKPETAVGSEPVFVVHDELGQVKGPSDGLFDALETGSSTVADPISFVISTQAATDGDLLSRLIDDILKPQDGKEPDPRLVVCLHTAPMDIDAFSEDALKAANPAYGIFAKPEELLQKAEEASRMPSMEPGYRNLNLNQRVETHSPFVSKAQWDRMAAADIGDWNGKRVWAGLDLALVNDLSALVLMWEDDSDDKVRSKSFFWLPEGNVRERAEEAKAPYLEWVKAGRLILTPGVTTDFTFIADQIVELKDNCDFQWLAFDMFRWNNLLNILHGKGISQTWIDKHTFKFNQNEKFYDPALSHLEKLFIDGRFIHDNNPVQNWNMGNAAVKENAFQRRTLLKLDRHRKIDGAVALAMAAGVRNDKPAKKAIKKPIYWG